MKVFYDAMREHIAFKVLIEKVPFCYKDFLYFVVDGQEYRMTHGTFRNYISKLIKNGEVDVQTRSNPFFYTLKGHRFDNSKLVTRNHMAVSNNNYFYNFIIELPLDKQSVHNIRLNFNVKGIWIHFANNFSYSKNSRSQDISIPSTEINDIVIKITIHKSDTVSIILGCSLNPIPLDGNGLILLSTTLTRIEERLSNLIQTVREWKIIIPNYLEWIVKMWHFGRDSLTEYVDKKFSFTFEESQACIIRAYVKEKTNKRKTIVRLERQEYPNKKTKDIIKERINQNDIHDTWITNLEN